MVEQPFPFIPDLESKLTKKIEFETDYLKNGGF